MELHRLAASLEAEGVTRPERHVNLTHELLALPPLVRQELLGELRFLLSELTSLEPVVADLVDEAKPARMAK